MSTRRWMWVTLVASLLLGLSLGILVDRFVIGPQGLFAGPSDGRRSSGGRLLSKLTQELELSTEQEAQLEQVLQANREKARTFWADSRREFDTLRQEFRKEIRSLLTPQQQRRFDALMEKEDAAREKRRKQP